MKRVLLGALVLCATAFAGCNNNNSSTPAAPTPAAASITETFTGTVPVGGADFHNFTVGQYGYVTFTMTAAGPPATIQEYLEVGSAGAGVCVIPSVANSILTAANATAQLSGTLQAGSYCVQVRDALNQAAPITYSVTVTHP